MSDKLYKGWEIVIGLEVHAQISSKSKLFSRSPANFGADPNTNVSLYDAALPGQLPVLNNFCIEQAVKTGIAIDGTINKISVFDRKNYFYPDLPSGYQISQLYHPIVTNGKIVIEEEFGEKTINIERIHIEQDAGKSIHDLSPNETYIDLNRSGVPLMEIVSQPDMRSSSEAMQYVKKLRMILRYVGTCDCNMEKGNIRFDANVSIHKPGTPFGTRTEIKNINSIKFLGFAIDYEVERQVSLLEIGGKVVQETRLFDPNTGETKSMRSKEDAADYRYFPDPDLKPITLTDEFIKRIRNNMPELPDAKKKRFIDIYALNIYDANILIEDIDVANKFEEAVNASRFASTNSPKLIANWMISEVFAVLNKEGKSINELDFPIIYIAEMVDLIIDGTISGKIAKTVLNEMFTTKRKPADIVQDMGLSQISDETIIREVVEKVLKNNQEKVKEYKSGKDKLFGFFVGVTMKELAGKGNPEKINKIIKEVLGY
ncbi:MAG: Asp-tRNA(Asn)/Glu-tRNA(Gln) amidotransferase subunit GatB [Holosporales bacterium]|jgi:aspartyl-tRNA(Asn)/glutamyl-tRNA(Gln) amidotransferase subunit B|nr:Asp-tRNA(Asn)/Glu-tRNA(Gln) amidotransferase subunit GatB [Holosporales bacterium]